MPDDRGVHQSQTANAESVHVTRLQRNLFIVGGGDWAWDATNGVLSWSASFSIYVGSVGKVVIPSGTITNVLLPDDVVSVSIDRSVPSVAGGVQSRKLNDGSLFSDNGLVLAVRGDDSRLYFRDGTVFSHGETKQLGAAEASTDRVDYQSDGRLYPEIYVLGELAVSATGNGDTNGSGLGFEATSGTPGFLTQIPNTGGVPDNLALLEIDTGSATEIIPIANVDSNTELTLVAPGATGSLVGRDWKVHINAFGYDVGTDQLAVFVGGQLETETVDYNEIFGPGISYAVQFLSGQEPPPAARLSFVNIAGGMGPSGPDVSTTLQEAYDNSSPSRQIDTSAGQPVVFNAPAPADVVIAAKNAGGANQAELNGAGRWVANEYWVPDGAGDHFLMYVAANRLRFEHRSGANRNGFEMSNLGDLRPFKNAAVGGKLPWVAAYSGTFDSVPSLVTINTGITTGVYGAVLLLEDGPSGMFYITEMNKASTTNDEVTVFYNQGTGQIMIANAITGGNPGTDFASQDWRVLMFYEG